MPAHQAPSSSGTDCQLGVVRTATTLPVVPPSSSQSRPATFADQLASDAVDSSVRPAPYQVIRGRPESPVSNGPSRVAVTPSGRGRVTGSPSRRSPQSDRSDRSDRSARSVDARHRGIGQREPSRGGLRGSGWLSNGGRGNGGLGG